MEFVQDRPIASSVEHDDLPHPNPFPQPIEAFVDLLKLQAMRKQLVDRQEAGAEEGDHARHVALGADEPT